MRLLTKILKKLALFAILFVATGYVAKYGWRFAMQASGTPQISSEEADLMSTVFDSAVKLVSGSAKKDDLAKDLSDKLYAGRGNSQEMAELGIEIVRPGGSPSAAPNGAATPGAHVAGTMATVPPGKAGSPAPPSGAPPSLGDLKKKAPVTLLDKLWERLRGDRVGLAFVPAAFIGLIMVRKIRRRPTKMEEFMPLVAAMQNTGDSDPYDMQHGVHALGSEDFELLVALIYQRQGYRVSMPAGLSGGRGGDFTLARKAEHVLVQCKKQPNEHKIAVERVREFHEAMVTANLARGLYVASCGFSWDARHFAKTKGITLINGRTLDQLLTAAREDPEEDLLAVARWAPRLMQKVTVTPALCPTCDAAMDEIVANGQTVWLCSQRPDCRGRRSARKHRKPIPGSVPPAAKASVPQPTTFQCAPVADPGTKSVPRQSVRVKPKLSKQVNSQRPAPKAVASKPTVLETAPPPQPEPCERRPATLMSAVPRKRPVPASDPAPPAEASRPPKSPPPSAGAYRLANPPATVAVVAAAARRAAGASSTHPPAGNPKAGTSVNGTSQ